MSASAQGASAPFQAPEAPAGLWGGGWGLQSEPRFLHLPDDRIGPDSPGSPLAPSFLRAVSGTPPSRDVTFTMSSQRGTPDGREPTKQPGAAAQRAGQAADRRITREWSADVWGPLPAGRRRAAASTQTPPRGRGLLRELGQGHLFLFHLGTSPKSVLTKVSRTPGGRRQQPFPERTPSGSHSPYVAAQTIPPLPLLQHAVGA